MSTENAPSEIVQGWAKLNQQFWNWGLNAYANSAVAPTNTARAFNDGLDATEQLVRQACEFQRCALRGWRDQLPDQGVSGAVATAVSSALEEALEMRLRFWEAAFDNARSIPVDAMDQVLKAWPPATPAAEEKPRSSETKRRSA